jgi:hypothetical protein
MARVVNEFPEGKKIVLELKVPVEGDPEISAVRVLLHVTKEGVSYKPVGNKIPMTLFWAWDALTQDDFELDKLPLKARVLHGVKKKEKPAVKAKPVVKGKVKKGKK